MAKFKCKLSDCVYEFTSEHDIKTMKEHPDYVEVVEVVEEAQVKRTAGRPKTSVTEE